MSCNEPILATAVDSWIKKQKKGKVYEWDKSVIFMEIWYPINSEIFTVKLVVFWK